VSVGTAQLATIRTQFNKTLPDLCTITKPSSTETRDSFGEVTTGSENVGTGVKCSYTETGGLEKLIAAGIASVGDMLVTLESSMIGLIESNMTIVVAARSPEPQRTFQVKRALESSLMVGVRVLCTES
jgi:hypothetical protein